MELTLSRCVGYFNRHLLRYVNDADIAKTCELCRFQHDIDVLIQPVLEVRVRHTNVKSLFVIFDELGGLEPGVVALLINSLFDELENLLPIIHWNVQFEKGKISTVI